MLALPSIPQSQEYHNFSDQRSLFGIQNCFNVISNLPFLLVGVLGLHFLMRLNTRNSERVFIEPAERLPYLVLFLCVALTSFGSAYYHLLPNNDRLVWDRLPMTIVFMSLFAATITERISVKAGLVSLLPLLAIGTGSVIYWDMTERGGMGDLRVYIIVQFYTMLAIPILVFLFPSRYSRGGDLFIAVIIYAFAKIFELLDLDIFELGHITSGHTLKHIARALSAIWILRMLEKRAPDIAYLTTA